MLALEDGRLVALSEAPSGRPRTAAGWIERGAVWEGFDLPLVYAEDVPNEPFRPTALALLQNSQALAVLAVSGGFLAPILTSTGSGNYVALFSYYAVINAGILWLAERLGTRERDLDHSEYADGVIIGLAQALALFPGISRSGVTLAAGLGEPLRSGQLLWCRDGERWHRELVLTANA